MDVAPSYAHVHTSVSEHVELARALPWHELVDVRAFLAKLPRWEAWAAWACSVGSPLRHPIAMTGGCYDTGHDVEHARGNGWGQLTGALLGTEAQRARTAAAHWQEAHEAGGAVRLPRYNCEKSSGRKWKAPDRRRRDGTPRASAGREYTRHFVQGEAYFSAAVLKKFYNHPELAKLRAAIGRALPDRWREHARFIGGLGGRVGYWHRIKRTRADARLYREARLRGVRKEPKFSKKQREIIAHYYSEKREVQKGRGSASGGDPRLRAAAGSGPPARHPGQERYRGTTATAPHAPTSPARPALRPETAPARESSPAADVLSPVDARAFLRALFSE